MSEQTPSHSGTLPVLYSRLAGAVVLLLGILVLAGWAWDVAALKSVLPEFVPMQPNAALALALSGIALLVRIPFSSRSPAWIEVIRPWLVRACAAVVAVIGVLTLAEYVLGRDFGIDQLLLKELPGAFGTSFPGRMAPATALNFVLVGAAFLLADVGTRDERQPAQWLALAAGLIALVATIGYAYGVESLYRVQVFASMSLHAALAFLLLASGFLCTQPDRGLIQWARGDDPGGILVRRLLPAAILVPIILGWLRLWGQRADLYDTEFGLALYATANVAILSTLVWWTAGSLRRADAERKRAEEQVRESAAQRQQALARARALLEAAPDPIIIADRDGRIVLVNAQTESAFGYERAELLGQPVETLMAGRFHETHARQRQSYFDDPRARPMGAARAVFARRKDGSEFPVDISLSPLATPEGPLVISTVRDIADRLEAQEKLQSQLDRIHLLNQITRAIGKRQDLPSIFQVVLRSLEDSLPIDFGCICLYDPVDHMLTVAHVGARSEALATELAMTAQARVAVDENGLSRCLRGQLVYEPDIAEVPMPFPQRLAGAGLGSLVAAPLQVETKIFGILVCARREARSFSSGECEFLRQLSEHVALATHHAQLYAALQQAYDDLRQTQQAIMQQERLRALGQMASGMAHDINNAISPAALYAESLLENEPDLSPRARAYLATIQHALEDVAQTVSRMREFYRQREPQLTLARVDLNRVVQQVVDLTRPRWSDMPQQLGIAITLHTELALDLPPVMGVESDIREALTNLVFNAVDAMPEGGALTLRTRTTESAERPGQAAPLKRVQVEVGDTGVGMDEDTRRRCLEPFFTTKGERGTGLGLAMVYGMVQRHSVDLEIDSEPGKGTTVRLIFRVATAASPAAAPPEAQRRVRSRLRILVVDDDPFIIQSLRDTLETDGHLVVTANAGQAGINVFRAAKEHGEPFAVVITDLGMPHMDGRRVASAVKAASPSTPVILLTGWGQRMTEERDMPLHVDRILSKPPKLRDLREALAALVPD